MMNGHLLHHSLNRDELEQTTVLLPFLNPIKITDAKMNFLQFNSQWQREDLTTSELPRTPFPTILLQSGKSLKQIQK